MDKHPQTDIAGARLRSLPPEQKVLGLPQNAKGGTDRLHTTELEAEDGLTHQTVCRTVGAHPVNIDAKVKEGSSNFASCGIDCDSPPLASDLIAENAVCSSPIETDHFVSKTALELAIERCAALADKSDLMMNQRWGKRAAPILRECLTFLGAYRATGKQEQQRVRKCLQKASGVRREPNSKNLPLIAVYLCVSGSEKIQTKKQRTAWCRFATVVKVADLALIDPDESASWLEKKTLNGILVEWQERKKAEGKNVQRPTAPKLKDYAHLAAALAVNSKFQELAKAELARVEKVVAAAMAQDPNAAFSEAAAVRIKPPACSSSSVAG